MHSLMLALLGITVIFFTLPSYSYTFNVNNKGSLVDDDDAGQCHSQDATCKQKMTSTAVFGAGCFWGVEEKFRTLKGVQETTVGYAGGDTVNPTYEQICADKTGHAEVVKIDFNPEQITYKELLDVFWKAHDPTTVNRQGPDVGRQYRSVIFYANKEQEKLAHQTKDALIKKGIKAVTDIIPSSTFYNAEDYHQKYIAKRKGLL
ncbi:Peptide methionine sulfoxide reductase MsrA [Trichoplax sp. H2]|nr:Peptide methionine sulfoxide reductase MsrA [Trichoplax sp. H2]|eukprot:RDD38667.1 Peptide methionine sulfoxide reductase MsrA [Trichoplax sp. H2]